MKICDTRKTLLIAFLLSTCLVNTFGQSWPTDSINNVLDNVSDLLSQRKVNEAKTLFDDVERNNPSVLDENPNYHFVKARLLNLYHDDNKGSIAAYEMAKALFSKEKEWRKVAIINGNIADVYTDINELDKTKEYQEAALAYFERHQEDPAYPAFLGGLARTHIRLGNYLKAADIYMETLKFHEKTDDAFQIGRANAQVGLAYDYANMYQQAKQYYQKAIEYRLVAQDTIGLINTYNNMGIVNKNTGNHEEAIHYYQLSYDMAASMGLDQYKINALTNLGVVHRILERYDEAIAYYQESLKIATALGREDQSHTLYNNLAHLYNETGQYRKALELSTKAVDYALEKNSLSDKSIYLYIHARSLKGVGRYAEATDALLQSKIYSDSLYQKENAQQMAELSTRYETEKKEQQIEILSQEAAIQQLKLHQRGLLLIGTVILLSVVALLIYFVQNRRKIRAEARLQREAAQQVLQAEERERRRIASDLHDGVGQMLSAALLTLNQTKELTEEHSAARQMAERSIALLSESYDEMRSVSHQMMPNALLKAGLGSSVKEFVEKINGDQIRVTLDVVGLDGRLDEQTETVLYRIIQEAVNNVVKHAQASKLSIQLIKDDDGLTATIEDNGKGFDTTKRHLVEGIGLKNITSRVAFLDGTMDVDSAIGRGTLLAIHIPVA